MKVADNTYRVLCNFILSFQISMSAQFYPQMDFVIKYVSIHMVHTTVTAWRDISFLEFSAKVLKEYIDKL